MCRLLVEMDVAAVALVFTFWMIAGTGQFAVYLSMLIFLAGFVMMACLHIQLGRFGVHKLEDATVSAEDAAR